MMNMIITTHHSLVNTEMLIWAINSTFVVEPKGTLPICVIFGSSLEDEIILKSTPTYQEPSSRPVSSTQVYQAKY